MKPHRIRMTHSLVMNYGLYKKMEIFVRSSFLPCSPPPPPASSPPCVPAGLTPLGYDLQRAKPATRKEMAQFHTDEYVDFLGRVTPDLVEAAAEGSGGAKVAGLAREMGRCTSLSLDLLRSLLARRWF